MGGLELKLDGGSRIPGWTVPRVAQTGHLLGAAVQWAVNPRKPRLEGCTLWPGGMAPRACGPEKPGLPSSLAASRGVDGRMTGVLHSRGFKPTECYSVVHNLLLSGSPPRLMIRTTGHRFRGQTQFCLVSFPVQGTWPVDLHQHRPAQNERRIPTYKTCNQLI
ncbi:hypothetical protein GHT09_011772 [Marmota monax]|uniref:Uncharacterized protein n=1 Tax=Marmota monax TaxID=9995 RepID=A0A834PNC4_MARMO|nr:hypothetical protein GHT09_011772 [Marmota monax]